jgi:hypothetical membrane protein
MNDTIHGGSAVIFFLLFWIDMIIVTIQYYKLRKLNPDIITTSSLYTKCVICLLSIALFIEIIIQSMNPP